MSEIRERDGNRFRDCLRQRIGRHGIPVEMVAELTGITERRVRSHIAHDGTKPNSDDVAAYMGLFGPDLLNAWLAPYGIAGAYRTTASEGCILRATAHAQTVTVGLAGTFAAALEDMKIDHRERLEIPAHIISAVGQLSALAHGYAGALK